MWPSNIMSSIADAVADDVDVDGVVGEDIDVEDVVVDEVDVDVEGVVVSSVESTWRMC